MCVGHSRDGAQIRSVGTDVVRRRIHVPWDGWHVSLKVKRSDVWWAPSMPDNPDSSHWLYYFTSQNSLRGSCNLPHSPKSDLRPQDLYSVQCSPGQGFKWKLTSSLPLSFPSFTPSLPFSFLLSFSLPFFPPFRLSFTEFLYFARHSGKCQDTQRTAETWAQYSRNP